MDVARERDRASEPVVEGARRAPSVPAFGPAAILALQRSAGNRAVAAVHLDVADHAHAQAALAARLHRHGQPGSGRVPAEVYGLPAAGRMPRDAPVEAQLMAAAHDRRVGPGRQGLAPAASTTKGSPSSASRP